MPNSVSIHTVTIPVRPNNTTRDKAITNGGVMMGRMDMTCRLLRQRKPERRASSANAKPSNVLSTPANTASNREFHATPQEVPPARQPKPQMSEAVRRSHVSARSRCPVGPVKADTNTRATGKKTNRATSKPIVQTDPETKPSPRNLPIAAMPWENSTVNRPNAKNPPQPKPGWPSDTVPKTENHAQSNPRMPTANP